MAASPLRLLGRLSGLVLIASPAFAVITPLPDRVPATVADVQNSQSPDRVHFDGGLLGERVQGNEASRLAQVDTTRLLEGYKQRPGRQTWDGEHVGKWLHAATLAWANTGDPELRRKLDETVTALCSYQLADGYLGTYLEDKRWTSWDVWAHKYNLIGLITYMRYTGNQAPLETCKRMGDLLCRSFGTGPGQLDIIRSGAHTGMASTSVLEPMVLLYRFTGETRYLDFCRYIVSAWEQPHGPQIVSRLLELKRVDKVGNAKAYEMLSCLNGLLEYYRITGDARFLQAARNAWQDIVDHRLYLTGTASAAEHFRDDYDLPNTGNVGETCVTVSWLQFNAHLLRLTGEARFADQLERTVLNQLLGAQRPDCRAWGYYVELEGRKPYSETFDANCCLSSGPRGVALLPTFGLSTDPDGIVVNLYAGATADLTLRDGAVAGVRVVTDYPVADAVSIALQLAQPKAFVVKLRVPGWATRASVKINGSAAALDIGAEGYATLRRTWKDGDTVELTLPMELRTVVGEHTNAGRVAFTYGPLVLAVEGSRLPDNIPLSAIAFTGTSAATLQLARGKATNDQPLIFRAQGVMRSPADPLHQSRPLTVQLVPFTAAGGSGGAYRVWVPLLGAPHFNLATLGTESRSRSVPFKEVHRAPALNDGNTFAAVTTDDGHPTGEDWFAVTLPQPTPMTEVVFYHGRPAKNGGWFDASAGKPRVQVQAKSDGPWETVGELADYPATTSADKASLGWSNRFAFRLPKPVTALAVRVSGVPAGGENPATAHASCCELEIYGD